MQLQNKRIFYIEDNVSNRTVAQMILEREGAVFGFERWGGSDALARLKAFTPVDLILLDLMFPRGITGYDIFDHIRENPLFAHTPIVAISASDPTIEIPKARQKGFSGYISKPINLHLFAGQITSVLSGKPVW